MADFKSEKPYFEVVMQPAYVTLDSRQECCLGIPKKFSRKYMKDQGDVILCNSDGRTWSAEYFSFPGKNRRPYVRLRKGWSTFVRDNDLKVGDACAFELINCIEISFKVFINLGQKADFPGSQASIDVLCPVKRGAGSSSTLQGLLEPLKASQTALQRAMAFTSENPYFHVVLRLSYVRDALLIPNQFAREHFNRTLTNVDVVLSNGKSWPAEYHQQSIGRPNARICGGWKAFVRDNNLKVDDVCVFDMTKTSFNVFIYQEIADANCQPSQGVTRKPVLVPSQASEAASKQASKRPFFRRFVRSPYLKGHYVDIPYRFIEQYFKPSIQMVKLQVADRSWPVKITSDPHYHIAGLTSGWIEFARENSLAEGDVCVLSLIQ